MIPKQVSELKVSPEPVLEMRHITKEFTGTRVLHQVNLKVFAGEVVALLGENGAGKSTLMKILCGAWTKGSYEGEILLSPRVTQGSLETAVVPTALPVAFNNTRDALRAGVSMIHQELSVFHELTVAEHLELDRLPTWIDWKTVFERTQQFLDTLGFGLRAQTRVGDLSVGCRQLVEIARSIYRNARVIIFDEPTSALSEQEVSRLYGVIDRLRSEGKAIIYITHRFDEVFRLADRIVVLRDGQNTGEVSMSSALPRLPAGRRTEVEPQLITWMVGRPIHDIYPKRNLQKGQITQGSDPAERPGALKSSDSDSLLQVKNLTVISPKGRKAVQNLSLTLRKGEILGLGGLLGAGRSETLEGIFGVFGKGTALSDKAMGTGSYQVSGEVYVKGRKVNLQSPRDAIRARMAYVSEDRKDSGLVLNHSIRSNLTLPSLAARVEGLSSGVGLFARIRPAAEEKAIERWMKDLRIKSTNVDQRVSELSGGNQQKIVLAKWLLTSPEILLLDEPTRGIDIGAKVEIYQWIRKLSDQGIGVLMASSEMPELLGLCDRILVLREGELSGEFSGEHTTQEDMMRAASL